MSRVYLDHSATSPLRPEAREAMLQAIDGRVGNASSVHGFGHRARMIVESAREEVARLLGAKSEEIVLTGSGTEANNLALFGAATQGPTRARRIVTSSFEHPSVLAVVGDLEERGFEVVRVSPELSGVVRTERVVEEAVPAACVVSVMLANNEIGTVQPVHEMAGELRRHGILVHSDAAQAAGKLPIDVRGLGVDLLSIAAHKFGGPQGAGALFVRQGLVLRPLLRGGGQELNRRPGTENVAAIAGFGAAAAAVRRGLEGEARHMTRTRALLEERLLERCPGVKVNGAGAPRVANISSLAFEGVTGEALVIGLDLEGIAVSAGSACSAGTIRRSPSLLAMGLEEESRSSIRVSLGPETTPEEVDTFVGRVVDVLTRLRHATAASAVARSR